MTNLAELVGYFDELRQDGVDYTEESILKVLRNLQIKEFETVSDIPTRLVNQIFAELTESKCGRLDPNQEQEVLDFFESLLVKGKIKEEMIAKALRYLLRLDTSKKTALLIVDVQNDFISGSLALRNAPAGQEGEEVLPVINAILENNEFDLVAYSFDWHPENHCSFAECACQYKMHECSEHKKEHYSVYDKVHYDCEGNPMEQVLWPIHCVQESEGAELHPDLKVAENHVQVYKGKDCIVDSYSAFWDNGRLSQTILLEHILDKNITTVLICGLAYDFCVGMTALDSAGHGLDTYVMEDAVRSVAEESTVEMKEKLEKIGVKIIQSSEIPDIIS